MAQRQIQRKDEHAPSLFLLLLPFIVFAAAALTAAAHKLLGEPLGAAVGAKLGDATVTLMMMVVVYGPYMRHAQRQNAIAASHEPAPERRLPAEGRQSRERASRQEDPDDEQRRTRRNPRD